MTTRPSLFTAALLSLAVATAALASEKPSGVTEALEAQILLARANFSPGVLDGYWGDNTYGALHAFQKARGLETTKRLDEATREALTGGREMDLVVEYTLEEEDVAGPFVDEIPEEMSARAKMERLSYTSVEEALAEQFHLTLERLRALNPEVTLEAGGTVRVPNLRFVEARLSNEGGSEDAGSKPGEAASRNGPRQEKGSSEDSARESGEERAEAGSSDGRGSGPPPAAKESVESTVRLGVPATPEVGAKGGVRIVVDESDENLVLLDESEEILFYAPVTPGSEKAPIPYGEWEVKAIAVDPTFHYDPELFWDAELSDELTTLPPGPNNPVGVVWIGISKEHYGIHGTPEPTKVGYTASHGCVRMTNWDALYLAHLVDSGTKVVFQE